MISEESEPASDSLTRAYARLLSNELLPSRSGSLKASDYPLHCRGPVAVSKSRVKAYRDICGLADSDDLPPLYPQVAAMPLHLQLLSTPGLPGRSVGVVHVGQRVKWHRPMPGSVPHLDIEAILRPGKAHPRGQLFHMDTHLYDEEGALLWEGESLFLFRGVVPDLADDPLDRVPPSAPGIPEASESRDFKCPAGIGRSYARISGDWNPIHLSSMSARLFGFQCPIVHGMWALARALAEVGEQADHSLIGQELEAWFNAPLFWPSETRLHVSPGGGWFQVDRAGRRPKPALWGRLTPIHEYASAKRG
ncbi:acyl dehydratase [Natronospira proteinivora]|uniref:Acyl dehydratase n=1 Tax=Natronospira proteinivora TaxID=1807133 RepID=A0ABT1G6A4_9GAMM|nr:MaoC/PaaZ C-terminal domain-containing protein [Natronospira proteinivora]MCP1726829.1 acyl dehydratase [Natronospira proteinivora]